MCSGSEVTKTAWFSLVTLLFLHHHHHHHHRSCSHCSSKQTGNTKLAADRFPTSLAQVRDRSVTSWWLFGLTAGHEQVHNIFVRGSQPSNNSGLLPLLNWTAYVLHRTPNVKCAWTNRGLRNNSAILATLKNSDWHWHWPAMILLVSDISIVQLFVINSRRL